VNAATFVQHFPEFRDVDATLIEAKLAEASSRMGLPGNEATWGCFATQGQPAKIADTAQGNLAADILITSPTGGATLMVADKSGKPSVYRQAYDDIVTGVCVGPFVTGGVRWGFIP
jgi:hypothetical protein